MSNKTRVPKLRFKGFQDEWEENQLKDISTIKAGGDVDKNQLKESGKYPVIANNLSNNGIVGYYDDFYKIDRPVVTVTGRGTVGVAKYRNYKFTPIVRVLVLSSDIIKGIFAESVINRLNILNESTGVPQLTSPQLGTYFVKYPSLSEQEKIGNLFSKLDKLITKNSKKLNDDKLYKKSLVRNVFPINLRKKPYLRFSGYDDDLYIQSLNNLGNTFTGLSGKTKEDFGHGEAKYIPYLNVFENTISKEFQLENIDVDMKQNQVKYGDIFFTTSSETPLEVGMSSLWLYNSKNVYLNSFCFGYRLYDNQKGKVDYVYLGYMLRSPLVRTKMKILAQGISRYNISKSKVMAIDVKLPSFDEQKKVGRMLQLIDKKIELQGKYVEQLKQLKKAYLQKMFC